MYFADMHTHTYYSPDSREPMENMARTALKRGLDCMCFTDHCDIIRFKDPSFSMDFNGMRAEYERLHTEYKNKLRLLYGIELGEATHAPDIAKQIVAEQNFDFVLGSIHNLKNGDDFYYLKFETKERCEKYIGEYLDELTELCKWGDFDSLSHITYPLRYMVGRENIDVDFSGFTDRLTELFGILIKRGKALELNTSGVHGKYGEFMPYPELLKLYRDCGGKLITVGSDAHRAAAIRSGLTEGYALLKRLGFNYIAIYENRTPKQIMI